MILVLDRSGTQSTVQFVEEPHESSPCSCPAPDLKQVASLALEGLQGIGTPGLLHPFQEHLLEPLLVEFQLGEKMIRLQASRTTNCRSSARGKPRRARRKLLSSRPSPAPSDSSRWVASVRPQGVPRLR